MTYQLGYGNLTVRAGGSPSSAEAPILEDTRREKEGIERELAQKSRAFRDEQGLSVQLLSDTDAVVSPRKHHVIDKKVVDGKPREALSPSTFIIDKKGILRHILRDVSPKDHADEVLKKVKSLNGRATD